MVNCGTAPAAVGGPAKRLFIEPATSENPLPTVRIGHSADRSDAYYPGAQSRTGSLVSWEIPVFEPPMVNVFVCTAQATDTTVALRHYPRWDLNAAS